MKFGTIIINRIDDPFNPHTSKVTKTDIHGGVLSSYLDGYCLGANILVTLNGKIISNEEYDTYIVKPNDNISYVHILEGGGGGGKQIMAMVSMIALAVVAPMAATYLVGTGLEFGATLGALSGMEFAMGLGLTATFMVAGSLLVNSVFGASASSVLASDITTESSTYSWSGIQTSRDLNKPIPVLYGTHALGGTVINSRFYYNGSDDWIGTQLALCHGEIEPIYSSNIKVNNNDYSSLITDATSGSFQYRIGSFDQSIMTGYSDSIYNNATVSGILKSGVWKQIESTSTNIDFFRLHIEFPSGLYTLNTTTGKKENRTVILKAQYRQKGSTTWNNIYNYDTNGTMEWLYTYQEYEEYWDWESYRVEDWVDKTMWSSSESAQPPLGNIRNFIKTSTYRYNKDLPFAPNTSLVFTAASSIPLKKYFEPLSANGTPVTLNPAQYEFRLLRVTADEVSGDNYNMSEVHLRFLEEVNTADINYGGIALLGIDLKATDQLSSSRPNFIITCTRKPLFLNGVYRSSTNPAWICLDILTNQHYGMGLPFTDIDLTEFERWAAFCDGGTLEYFNISKALANVDNTYIKNNILLIPEANLNGEIVLNLNTLNRNTSSGSVIGYYNIGGIEYTYDMGINGLVSAYNTYISEDINTPDGHYLALVFSHNIKLSTDITLDLQFSKKAAILRPKLSFNGIFDTSSDIWTSIQDTAQVGRGQIVLRGNKYSCIYDSVKTIKGLFNATNSKNVTVQYLSTADIATEIEIQYSDKAIDYEMNSISVQDSKAMASGIRSNKTTKQIKGITTEAEALTTGRYLLSSSKMLRRIITLDADIEAITQTVGDLVAIQTDVTQYGIGGLVEKTLNNYIYLDNTVQLEKGKTYTVKFKSRATDEIQEFNFIATDSSNDFTIDDLVYTYVGELTFDDFSLGISFEDSNYLETNLIALNGTYNINTEDRYTFGIQGSDSILCTIRDISREGDLTRKITAVEYNESILDFNYDNDMIQRINATGKVKNSISNFVANDRLFKQSAGQVVALVSFGWDSKIDSYYNIFLKEDGGFKNYLGNNIKGTRYEYANTTMIPEQQYTIYIEDAKDMTITSSMQYTITSFSAPPEDITNVNIVGSSGINLYFDINYINKPLDFKYYNIYRGLDLISTQVSDKFFIPHIKGTEVVTYNIEAVDMINKVSNKLAKNVTITTPYMDMVNSSYAIIGDNISVNIVGIKGTFDIDYFTISYYVDGSTTDLRVITTKESVVSIPADYYGVKEFIFNAYDMLGNKGADCMMNITVLEPSPVNLSVTIDGKDMVLTWENPKSVIPIDYYKIEYDNISVNSKSTSFRIPITWGGTKTFYVSTVNNIGVSSVPASKSLSLTYGIIDMILAEVIDNNVLLKWTSTAKSLPIENFMIYKGNDINNLVDIGEKKGTFTTIFENEAGIYKYWIGAIDSAGNIGELKSVSAIVSAPPDYVLNANYFSEFNGTLSNAKKENTKLIIPINNTETISNHFTINSWTTAQQQVNAGNPLWIQPFPSTGYYEEIYDYGGILPTSLVSLNLDYNTIVGTPTIIPLISLSSDGITYIDYPNQLRVYGSGFRYIKIRVTVTGSNNAIKLNSLNIKLDAKIKSDVGSGSALASDIGGTVVNFNVPFTDITSISVTPIGTTPIIAIYDFNDIPNPTSFKVLLFNTSGARVSGNFSWSAKGY